MQPRLTLKLRSSCLTLLRVGITGIPTPATIFFKRLFHKKKKKERKIWES
jgi:hypothetical protein